MRQLLFHLFLALILVPVRVAFVGDSITGEPNGYVSYVEQGHNILSARFLPRHLADAIVDWPYVDEFEPDTIVVELGAHAVIGCDHLPGQDMAVFEQRYSQILDRATRSSDHVVVLTIPWLGWGENVTPRAQQYSAVIERLAAQYKAEVVDAWEILHSCGAACVSADGVHPNGEGHRRVAEAVSEVLLPKQIPED